MRAALTFSIAALGLAGCSSESDQARAELAIIEKAHGNGRDTCAARRKLSDALLHERKAEEYKFEKMLADAACLNSDIHERFLETTGGVEPAN